ncbi:hypothetical protein CVV43_00110 [Candidatus Saccharibacteria bacterium HGW-Saccharibacteria-1]|jgi:hypothetical protein|nr:MAG: hypothetical protein CVV43_00110 [Candidatus Saccharibacteria bacterium HGW-Saccharibacteria-1]
MNRAAKIAIRLGVSAVVLLIIIVGGGIFYIWYSGQNSAPVTIEAEPTPIKTSVQAKPAKIDENANVGVVTQSLTSPVKPGSNSSIIIKTNPKADCVISVIYNKVASTDSGLVAKVADEYGVVSWTWTVSNTVPLGKWPVKVTCSHNKKSGVGGGDLVVTDAIVEE